MGGKFKRVTDLSFACLTALLISPIINGIPSEEDSKTVHSRLKRFVAFPEGSSFTIAICVTIGVIGNPDVNFLSYGLNWGLSYDLPNTTWYIRNAHGFKNDMIENEPVIHRRYRRNVYHEIGVILDRMGYRGRDCILRALCESKKFFFGRVGTMEEELVKTIFSLPFKRLLARDLKDNMHEYYKAYQDTTESCASSFPCEFSLIALAFGRHSKAQINSM